MKTKNHRLGAVAACVVAACTLAACASSSSRSSATSSAAASAAAGSTAARSKLVACLKQHGVTPPAGGFRHRFKSGSGTPPPGGVHGGGIFGGGGSGGGGGGGFRANPKLAAAFKACGGASFPSRRFSLANRRVAIDNFVKCVRQHGYELPTPNLTGSGPVFPRSIEAKAKFQTASRACASLLAPRGGPPPGAQSSASSAA